MKPPIRVGAVSYLNAKPLYYRLCEFAPEVRLSMDVPSRLAEQLADGSSWMSRLIPSVEYLRGAEPGYEIIPGFAIAARARAKRQAVQPGAVGPDRSAWRSMPGRGRARRWRGSGSMRGMACGRPSSRSCRWASRCSRARPTRCS